MSIDKIIATISKERFYPYLNCCMGNKNDALSLYQKNIEISQTFYALLSVLEVTLRNKIDNSCKIHFDTDNWLQKKLPPELLRQIIDIEIRLSKSKKEITNSRILAELNFGFWTTLFNRKYAKLFWKPLHRIFPNIPNENKKRTEVSSRLNHIRTFRNRIYHYEPIIWNATVLKYKKDEIFEVISWLDLDTSKWANQFDKFNEVMNL